MSQSCPHCTVSTESSSDSGAYRRLFPELSATFTEDDVAMGKANGPMAVPEDTEEQRNPRIAAAWPFYAQILAHDITRDRSPLQKHQEAADTHNYRAPRLNLECLYGGGPVPQPYFYDYEDTDKFLIGINDADEPNDLPRNQQGVALIPDARNDTYLFISQLHLALMKLHNRLVDELRAQDEPLDDVFARAQQLTRWHHQWIIVHDYLPGHVGEEMVRAVLEEGFRLFDEEEKPYVPVEFAAGAFRFGHAQVLNRYTLNDHVQDIPIFPDMVGQRALPADHVPDWKRLFSFPGAPAPQTSKRMDAAYAAALLDLPPQLTGPVDKPEKASLAYRDLQRAASLNLPSGEQVAQRLGITPLDRAEMNLPEGACPEGTPLSYYILREATVQHQGEYLGEVGGRMVAEVLLYLLKADPTSYLSQSSDWRPTLPAAEPGTFRMSDLLVAAGVA